MITQVTAENNFGKVKHAVDLVLEIHIFLEGGVPDNSCGGCV